MALDVDLYKATRDAPQRKGDGAPDLVEVGLQETTLMGIHELLQQLVHWAAASAPPKSKKPKIKRLPRPRTAKHLVAREEARAAHEHFEQVIVFVSNEKFAETIAAAQKGGD